jgi:hypothetical protein
MGDFHPMPAFLSPIEYPDKSGEGHPQTAADHIPRSLTNKHQKQREEETERKKAYSQSKPRTNLDYRHLLTFLYVVLCLHLSMNIGTCPVVVKH